MPLEIIRNDIINMKVDAIVNSTNKYFSGSGGSDRKIHEAAGPSLALECVDLPSLELGKSVITKGHNLPAKYIIHTVGPIWIDGESGEDKYLADAYRNSLELAKKYRLETIAFPLIASGTYGYPKDRALEVAIATIGEFLFKNDMMVYLVVYDKKAFRLSEKLFSSIKEYIDDNYVEGNYFQDILYRRPYSSDEILYQLKPVKITDEILEEKLVSIEPLLSRKDKKRSLENIIKNIDESFSQMLLRLIDESGRTDAEIYKRANIDRRLFSKIRNDVNYSPSKPTAIAFAIALQLNLDETKDLLLKAGFALSNSSKFDVIIRYFIENKNYNIFEINEALFVFDQNLLGS